MKCLWVEMPFLCYLVVSLFWSYAYAQSCVTPLGVRSQCLSIYDCPSLVSALQQNPLPSHVISFMRQSQCGFEGYTPKVCCGPLPSEQPRPQTTPRPRPQPTQQGDDASFSNEDSSPAPRNQCGVDTNGDRIYGGELTDLDEFPWMALLGYRARDGKIKYQCGGVLINHRYVLTAAHCTIGAVETQVGKLTTVRLGEYDTQQDIDCLNGACADPPQEIPVDAAYPHPGYSDRNRNRRDDIALVRLARRAKYTYYVQPICLADGSALDAGMDVFVAGWGKTLDGRNSPVKLKLPLPIVSKTACDVKFRTVNADLTANQICAGGVFSKDTCRGDSGGPLMKRRPEGIWETVGVVSFGNGCGMDGWPGVYSSVAGYDDWIRRKMRETNTQ